MAAIAALDSPPLSTGTTPATTSAPFLPAANGVAAGVSTFLSFYAIAGAGGGNDNQPGGSAAGFGDGGAVVGLSAGGGGSFGNGATNASPVGLGGGGAGGLSNFGGGPGIVIVEFSL